MDTCVTVTIQAVRYIGHIETALEGIDNLYNIIEKLVQVYEKIESKNA